VHFKFLLTQKAPHRAHDFSALNVLCFDFGQDYRIEIRLDSIECRVYALAIERAWLFD
jgi:hypothetical protein